MLFFTAFSSFQRFSEIMDYNILKTFRVFYQDYVLLFDAIQEYHRVRPSNKSLKEFTSGVAAMIEVEASIEKVQQGIVVTSKGETESEYSGLGLIVEIIRSVILEFIADEISQVEILIFLFIFLISLKYTYAIILSSIHFGQSN